MRHIIPVDFSTFPEGFHSRRLVGPKTESGIESCSVICSRVPPGCGGPALHTHPVDQFYYVISGMTNVQIGTETAVVGPDTLIFFPADTPHCNWNTGSEDEIHLEICAPAPNRDRSNVYPAFPRQVDGISELIRPVNRGIFKPSRMAAGSRSQHLARRSSGSNHVRIVAAEIQPGGGGASLHFHQFDQFYYILEGLLTVQIGLTRHQVGPHTLVVLPAATIHTNDNETDKVERHITFLVPEPEDGGRSDNPVQLIERADRTAGMVEAAAPAE